VPQRAKLLELTLADPPAWFGELLQQRFVRQLTVQRDQFSQFIAHGVTVRGFDGRQFEGEKDLSLIITQKLPQGRNVLHWPKTQQRGNRAECDEAVRRTELFSEWMPIAQPFGRVVERQLCFRYHVFGRQVQCDEVGRSP